MDKKSFIALLGEKQAQIKRDLLFCGELPDDNDPVLSVLSQGLQETIGRLEADKSELICEALTKEMEGVR
jgi:hypothetical protein